MRHLGTTIGALAVALWTAGCAAFDALEDCSRDEDCEVGERCHPQELFCELDRTPLVLGASLPLSGELDEFGQGMATALELAQSQLNAAGGVLGRSVRFDVLDDETSDSRAMENVQALVARGVPVLIGPAMSSQVLATQEVTAAAQIVQITPSAGADELSTRQPAHDRWLFRTVSTAERGSAAAMALFAFQGPPGGVPCRSMAILHVDDAMGTSYRDAVRKLFEKQGGCVDLVRDIPVNETIDYSEVADALVAAAPDCATLVAYPRGGVALLGAVEERTAVDPDHDWSGFFWLGTTSLHGSNFLETSGFHLLKPAEGVYGGDEDSTPLTTSYNQLRDLYNRHFSRHPTEELPGFVSNTYDAAVLAGLALHRSGNVRDRVAIRDGLWDVVSSEPGHAVYGPVHVREALQALDRGEPIHYKGASSSMEFDDRGTVSNPAVIWHVREGAFEIVRRVEEPTIEALLAAPATPDPECR